MYNKKLGVFLYNRFFDPVNQSNLWLYINNYLQIDSNDKYRIYLISYEDKNYPLTDEQKQRIADWKDKGLVWTKLSWNPGTSFFAKGMDILKGLVAVTHCYSKGCKHYVSLASVAGTFLYLYSKLLRIKIFLYSYEPHSEYAIDNKLWSANSLQYKISHYLERKAAENAKVIASGTRFMEHRLMHDWKIKGDFFRLPTVVNDKKFLFSAQNRIAMRNKLGFSNQTKVLFYPGKFGGLYYKEETAFMFKWILEEDSTFHFLIVTPQDNKEVIALMENAEIDPSSYTIAYSDYIDIHHYYSAADFAVIAVPFGPSKKFISNIKVGEYLTAGLPFLITEGVSEDYLYATEKNVGVVVKDFKKEYIKNAIPKIQQFLEQDKEQLRKHCRTVGLEYRGFEKLNSVFIKAVNSLFS